MKKMMENINKNMRQCFENINKIENLQVDPLGKKKKKKKQERAQISKIRKEMGQIPTDTKKHKGE